MSRLSRPLGRIIELAVFAPLGLIDLLRERWPACAKQLAQNRQAVANRVQLADLARRVAVDRARKAGTQRTASSTSVSGSASSVSEREASGSSSVSREGDRDGDVSVTPTHGTLPISDYQSLAAIHVVHRLGTLRPVELEQVRRFEQANRGRRTILAKIDQLQDAAR